jgi:glutamyl-tRNA synthetase
VVAGSAESIMHDLRWLGLDWDEGPDVGGPHAPYLQSQRTERYADAVARLEANDFVYPCTCSRKEIVGIASAPHGDLGPLYPGTCRDASARAQRPGRPISQRFKCPQGALPAFRDQLHGAYTDPIVDDFVLRRGDGLFSYQLAVVADDIAMNISEVVRGADLLSSTPRQLALYAALDAEPPSFLHVPLLLAPDGRRLSKRHGAPSIADYRASGVAPETIVGWLAHTLGLAARHEALQPGQLIARFELARVPLMAATVDVTAEFRDLPS